MVKNLILFLAVCLVLPPVVCGAPSSVYGKALQKAKNVTAQSERSRAVPEEKKQAAPKFSISAKQAGEIAAAIKKAKLKRYPVSGAQGVKDLLERKILTPELLGLPAGKNAFLEKELPIAWFGTEANKAQKQLFPLFIIKPGCGEVSAGFTNGTVTTLKKAPRSVTGTISVLRSSAKNKKSALWDSYLKRARKIDRSSK